MLKRLCASYVSRDGLVIVGLVWTFLCFMETQVVSLRDPRNCLIVATSVMLTLYYFVGFLILPTGSLPWKRYFLIDEATGRAERAPWGFYWRSFDGWFKKGGKRLIRFPFRSQVGLIINERLGLRVGIIFHHWQNPNEEAAGRVYRLFRVLEGVQDGSRDEIEAALLPFTDCAGLYEEE